MDSIDKEDLFNSVKKYMNTNDDGSSPMPVMPFDDSGVKAHKSGVRKLIDGFCRFDELERMVEEHEEAHVQFDEQTHIDLTNKLNVGKQIQQEVAGLIMQVCHRSGMANTAECKRINEMQQQLTQFKLKMPIEQSQLSFITLLREFFEKLMRALKIPSDNSKNGFDKHISHVEQSIFAQDVLGERLELDQLNGLYVDLLSILDIVSKQPEHSKRIMSQMAKSLEDRFTQAIWINKAIDLKNSDSIMSNQMPLLKFNDFLRQVPSQNAKAQKIADSLEAMKEKHNEYLASFKEVEFQLDEKKLTMLSSEQLKVLQVRLQSISRLYKAVPYALKLDLKQKQQSIERIVDSIEWSISAKGILEDRVDSIQMLEKTLLEQTQKQLSASQKLLIKDIQERIFAVKKSNTQLAQVHETVSQMNGVSGITKKFPVQLFIDLFDTYKDLNQYINLDAQLSQVEDYLKVYQDEEFALLKLSKGWMHKTNDEKIDLKAFKGDMETIKSLLKKSIFDWTKYEANIRGLEIVLRVREILFTADSQAVNPVGVNGSESSAAAQSQQQPKDENVLLLLGWKSVIELKEEIQLLESKDNFILKNFEGKNLLMRKIDDYLSVKSDLDNLGKRVVTVERVDEMSRILNSTFINCPQEKQRLNRLRATKEKILSEMREFDAISARKEKASMQRIQEVLELIKNSSIKLDEKKVQLERKIHIATQLIRIAKNANHIDIDRLVEQYHNQTVDIEIIEDIIRENKQVNKELDDFDVKLSYCYDDYEDLMELNQTLASVKPHFSRKRLLVLLQQKIFSLLSMFIWKQWSQRRPLFGFSFNSLKQILNQSESYNEHIIMNKNKIRQLAIFAATTQIVKKDMALIREQRQNAEEEQLRKILENAAEAEIEDKIYLEEDDMEDLMQGAKKIQVDDDEYDVNLRNSGEQLLLQDEEEPVNQQQNNQMSLERGVEDDDDEQTDLFPRSPQSSKKKSPHQEFSSPARCEPVRSPQLEGELAVEEEEQKAAPEEELEGKEENHVIPAAAARSRSRADSDEEYIEEEPEEVEEMRVPPRVIQTRSASNSTSGKKRYATSRITSSSKKSRLFKESQLAAANQMEEEDEDMKQIFGNDTFEEMEEEEIVVESVEDKIKRTQQQVIEERFEIDVSILKECRDAVRQMWESMMTKVRLIRSIATIADIEDFEQFPSKYAVGCVDLMDILIEQKILIQNHEERTREEQQYRRKIEEEQALIKQKQWEAQQERIQKQFNAQQQQQQPLMNQQQQQQLLQLKEQQQQQQQQLQQQQKMEKQVPGRQQQLQYQAQGLNDPEVLANQAGTSKSSNNVDKSFDGQIERMLNKASMKGFSEKHKKVARTIARSMLTNPHYKDMHVDLVENTVSYVVRRIIQFRYSDDYVEEMLELFEELKEDFYASEQYRKDSFSFKSFNSMMKFQHARLQDNVRMKKRKLNEENIEGMQQQQQQLQQQQLQLQQQQQQQQQRTTNSSSTMLQAMHNIFKGNVKPKGPVSKKIIDHNEYMNLDFKFSNTQLKDPLIKELHRLMQSKETLVQFRKLQADLNRIAGTDLQQDTKIKARSIGRSDMDDEDEDDDDSDVTQVNGRRSVARDSASSTGKSSVSSDKSIVKEQFSSDDEDETEYEIIQSHPSVIKYMRDAKVKKLIDPIRESEIDAFMDFCNGQLKQLYSGSNIPQMRIMYNPLTNDQEIYQDTSAADAAAARAKRHSSRHSHNYESTHDAGDGDNGLYDPEGAVLSAMSGSAKQQHQKEQQQLNAKNIYSLFEGRIHLRADTAVPAIEVTCFVETQEAIMKDCPVFKNSEEMLIMQTGESEMLETKEYLIKSYQCETILSLFGSVESSTEEGQLTLDSLAQDLKNRDRVSIAMWNTATKMYVFHKKIFERDHCGNRLSKKFALSSSELCFALIFKPVGMKQEQIDAIERIKDPKLYSQTYDDFLELQALKIAQKRETQEFKEAREALLAETQNKPQRFKKPLPKYRKDTLLKIYLPIKGSQRQALSELTENEYIDHVSANANTNGGKHTNLLNILLKPSRSSKEIEQRMEEMNSTFKMNSVFKKPSTVKNSAHKEAERDVKAFFERRLNGKRTVKQSLNKLDMIRLKKLPEQPDYPEVSYDDEEVTDEDMMMVGGMHDDEDDIMNTTSNNNTNNNNNSSLMNDSDLIESDNIHHQHHLHKYHHNNTSIEGEDIFANLTGQIDNLQTTINKSMAKKSVTYSDQVQKYPAPTTTGTSDTFSSQQESFDFEGIHDYSDDTTSVFNDITTVNGGDTDDSVSPLREPEKPSTQAKSLSSFKKSAGKSILRTSSRFGVPSQIGGAAGAAARNARLSSSGLGTTSGTLTTSGTQDSQLDEFSTDELDEDSINNDTPNSGFTQSQSSSMYSQTLRNLQLLQETTSEDSSDDTTPKYTTDSSVSSVSQTSIAKNRQKLLEFASILDQIKPSTLKSAASINKLSEISKISSSINPTTTFNSVSKPMSTSTSVMDEEFDPEDFSSSYSPASVPANLRNITPKNGQSQQTNKQQQQVPSHLVNLSRFRNGTNNNNSQQPLPHERSFPAPAQPQQPQQNNRTFLSHFQQMTGQNRMPQFHAESQKINKPPAPLQNNQQFNKPVAPMNAHNNNNSTPMSFANKANKLMMEQQQQQVQSNNNNNNGMDFQFQRMFDNKENKPNLHHQARPSADVDGLLTPQLSLSKESYSKGSVESSTSYSGKRSFNHSAFVKNSSVSSSDSSNMSSSSVYPYDRSSGNGHSSGAGNGTTTTTSMSMSVGGLSSVSLNPMTTTNSKFSVSSFNSRSEYSELTEDDERFEKSTPVIDKYMHNTFRPGTSSIQNSSSSASSMSNQQLRGQPGRQPSQSQSQSRPRGQPMLGAGQQFFNQPANQQRNQQNQQQQQQFDSGRNNTNNKSSAFIYEQDNYYKAFNKSISKNARTSGYSESDSDLSSSTSKVNENQLLDLRDQLDSLLSAIQHKKSNLHMN